MHDWSAYTSNDRDSSQASNCVVHLLQLLVNRFLYGVFSEAGLLKFEAWFKANWKHEILLIQWMDKLCPAYALHLLRGK
jgi:hypothetical protein